MTPAYSGFAKSAYSRGLNEVAYQPGASQIATALMGLERLRSEVQPTNADLGDHGITRDHFEDIVSQLSRRHGSRYNLNEIAPNVSRSTQEGGIIGAGIGGVLGGGIGMSRGNLGGGLGLLTGAAVGGGVGALIARYRAQEKRRRILATAKILKNYGAFDPTTLRRIYPLLVRPEAYLR